jgi:hypothetical protein
MPHSYLVGDALLQSIQALPNGASAVICAAIDLEVTTNGRFVAGAELKVIAPALTTAQLPNAATMTYDVVDSPDGSTWTTRAAGILVQTGAGGVGTNGVVSSFRWRPPTDVQRYIAVRATNSNAANASAASFTAKMVV